MNPYKPNPTKPKHGETSTAGQGYDALLDPLPVPEAVESDSDTAWGLWELSVHKAGSPPAPGAGPDSGEPPYFDSDTVPMNLESPPPTD